MSNVTAQAVQKYLNDYGYLSLKELAADTNTTPDQIRALEKAECIPATSYLVEGEMTFTSSFGTYALAIDPERFYHPSIKNWVIKALSLTDSHELNDVARIVRDDFDFKFEEALNGSPPPWPSGADYAWNYITDGTWGLCLKDVTVENLLTKEYARATIRGIVRPETDHDLTNSERSQLEEAVANFEKVALPFAPHEVADSCRSSEIQPAIEKYNVTLPIEKTTVRE